MIEKMNKEYYCHFELSIDIIGGKWKPIILYYLGKYGVLRYSEIKEFMPKINERVLTRQLKELQINMLITKKIYDEMPLKVEYFLTKQGESVIPILNDLKNWGRKYNEEIGNFKVLTEKERKIKTDKKDRT